MSSAYTPAHGVMEGKGAYNKYAKLPAGGAALAMPLLEKAVKTIELGPADQPLVIADYGSSQGKNSMAPMALAIRVFRRRVGALRPISVFHIDQPSNDFATLFAVLHSDEDRYVVDEPNVFPAAIGRSFYENVLPPASVHLGWSSYAAVWLSRIPALIPGHFFSLCSTGAVRAEFDRQGAKDWETFLMMRARELRSGGRLVVVLPAAGNDGVSNFESLMNDANAVLGEMVAGGAITTDERSRMVLGAYPRRKRDLLAPFTADGKFYDLRVENCDTFDLPDAAWEDYQRDGDIPALASKQALFFRSVFVPSLASALVRVQAGNAQALASFGDQMEERLRHRLTAKPRAIHSFVQAIVLFKR